MNKPHFYLTDCLNVSGFKAVPDANMRLLTQLESLWHAPKLSLTLHGSSGTRAHQHGCSTKHPHATADWKQTPSGEKQDICGVLLLFKHTKCPANVARFNVSICSKGKGIFGRQAV